MNKPTKAALAATTATALLFGGAGTLAYWSDSEDIGSTDLTSGTITLTAPDCTTDAETGTHGWQLDGGTAFDPETADLVPGDSISKVCEMTLTLVGEHIGATLAMSEAGLVDDGSASTTLDTELSATSAFEVDGEPASSITAPGAHVVLATVTVTFAGPDATNASQAGAVDLDALTLTATQTHA